jgi:acyl-homoserine lactone acylase PvdQ
LEHSPTGQSGNPCSHYINDQAKMYNEGKSENEMNKEEIVKLQQNWSLFQLKLEF